MKNSLARNWTVILIVFGIVASFVLGRQDARKADREQREQLVANCVRESGRTALEAASIQDSSNVRRQQGDIRIARRFEADAGGLLLAIPSPLGYAGSHALAQIDYEKNFKGRMVATLTQHAKHLQFEGCKRAFP